MSRSANDHPPLHPEHLHRRCDPEKFTFQTTSELEPLGATLGQDRALAAIEFAVGMPGDGYNLFVLGRAGSQKRAVVREFLASEAARQPAPSDWCYLNNFAEPHKPTAVELPPGRGSDLKQDMARLVEELKVAIPAAFESEHYRNRVAEISQEYEERHHDAVEALREEAEQENMSLVPTPHGFAIAPTRDGELLTDDHFEHLSEEDKQRVRQAIERITEKLREHLEQLPRWHKERRQRLKDLDREVTDLAVGQLIEQLKEGFADVEAVQVYLDQMREDVLANAQDFRPREERQVAILGMTPEPSLQRYAVNLIVDHASSEGAPIIYESHPSLPNLLGRVEHSSQFGTLTTDFSMIQPGALHRANGGYLVLDADRVLLEPFSWSALKRALFGREVRVESLGQFLSLVSTVTLEPEPIPLNVKIALVGERLLYYLLCEYDSDFGELFKVAADFEDRLDRTDETTELYARLIGTLADREALKPFARDAVARVIEHSARLLGDAEKLSTRLRDINDLLRESDYWAGKESSAAVSADHVQQAIDAQVHRLNRMHSQIKEEIQRRSILIDTDGARAGQVNGLSVYKLGSLMFGQPSRITATVRIGDGSVVDIERETELGGPIHSKGVLILTSYIGAKYLPRLPLSFSASLVFEQSYGGVEGDSASVAETCALLSALADLPVKQNLAVTGSLNQYGQVQVVGGVNEKIEGFFDICRARGLNGEQGVLLPADNVKHLMLRADVVQAAAAGQFHVYAIETIDQALSLLTGLEAGERQADGEYPRDTANHRVEQALMALAKLRQKFDQDKRQPAQESEAGGEDQ